MLGRRRRWLIATGIVLLAVVAGASWRSRHGISAFFAPASPLVVAVAPRPSRIGQADDARRRLADAALAQIGVTLRYDPAYVRLAYPGGDVPMDRGVCSDVVVRAFRRVGWDLQRCLHEDMRADFAAYPTRWGLARPDPSIDHRRVLNLMTWFERQGWAVPHGGQALAGDIVAWDLGGGLTHIGIVAPDAQGRPLIVHNIGQGVRQEDVLVAWKRIGHYRIPADPTVR